MKKLFKNLTVCMAVVASVVSGTQTSFAQRSNANYGYQTVSQTDAEDYYEAGIYYNSIEQYEAAFLMFESAAELDHKEAQFMLASYYLVGTGCVEDGITSMKWMKRSATNGCASAQMVYGKALKEGVYVNKNEREAVRWFKKAANQGHAQAQYELALCYIEGCGVDQNIELAAEYLYKSAKQGNEDALEFIALLEASVGY